MAKATAISWTDATWNPWVGCTKVSPGCASCYMYREQERYGNDPTVVRRTTTTFRDPLKWKAPRSIFTCSWSDFFHVDADPWRAEAWEIIRQTPHHRYLILTKRPERWRDCLPDDWADHRYPASWLVQPQWAHVRLGVSIENQRQVERIGKMPAWGKMFVSAEPLLGPLDLSPWMDEIDWVIVGGESGPDYRPMDLAWAKALQGQCRAADVPFFFKQRAGPVAGLTDGVPLDLQMRAFPA